MSSEPAAEHGSINARAGVGLRFQHHQAVIGRKPPVGWFEVHTENYMGGGAPLRDLDAIRRDYPISLHGVGLSLGSAEGLDPGHLARIRQVADRVEPGLISEHLSWSISGGVYLADLLPLPMTEEALAIVCRHVDQTQSCLRRPILVENPSSYLRFRHSTIPEWEFLAAVAARTGCGILCDVNNICVSAANHGWKTSDYLAALPASAIGEIHLAGHSVRELEGGRTLQIDDHGSQVTPEVWQLYSGALSRFGPVPTLIEWDTDVPPLETLLGEAARADSLLEDARNDSVVPTLIEVQCAMRRSLVGHDDREAAAYVLSDGLAPAARLNVYRNTSIGALTSALRLSYPAIYRLVGAAFFEEAARIFIEKEPPRGANLDEYGAGFPEFLALFPPAASLTYLLEVARLERAVTRALHAPDVEALDPSCLLTVDPGHHDRIVFVPHPSVGLVQADNPVDVIWRAVLAEDDAAMAAIDLCSGPVWLLVQRLEIGVDVVRINDKEWRFARDLCAGRPLQEVLDRALGFDAPAALAGHLAAGRFTGFKLETAP